MPQFIKHADLSLDGFLNPSPSVYFPEVVAFFKFEAIPLIEELSLHKLEVSNNRFSVESAAFGNGLRMAPQVHASFPISLFLHDEFSVGFWLNPINLEPVIDIVSGEPAYYKMPIIDKSTFRYTAGTSEITTDSATFVIYEECIEDNNNVMRIILESHDGDKTIIETPKYECGLMHYFWIAYSGKSEKLTVFIDGIAQSTSIISGSIPDKINVTAGIPLHINLSAIGKTSLLRSNSGLLDELIVLNRFIVDPNMISRHINYGSEFVINDTLLNRMEVQEAFIFDDPSSVMITSVYSNGKNVYAGRNDGKIYKGDRLMWESRKDFANTEELDSLNKNLLDKTSYINIKDGSLKIFKANVKI